MGHYPLPIPVAAEWEPGALLSVCPCTKSGSRAQASQHLEGQGGVSQGQFFQPWVSDAAATPRASGQLPARGGWALLQWRRLDPTLWGTELEDDGTADAEGGGVPLGPGMPLQLQQEPPRSLLLPICLVNTKAKLASCLGLPCPRDFPCTSMGE